MVVFENISKVTGRPAKLTRFRAAMMVRAIREGGNMSQVAEHLDIGISTLARWCARGRAGEPGYRDFVGLMARARESRQRNRWRRREADDRERRARLIAMAPEAERARRAEFINGPLGRAYLMEVSTRLRRSTSVKRSWKRRRDEK